MRNMHRSSLFSPTMKGSISLNLIKRYLITVLLIIIAVIYLAQNVNHSPNPQINYWEYYQHGFERIR